MSALDLRPIMGRSPLAWFVADGWVVCKRNLTRTVRTPQFVIFSALHPVVFILIFAYILGGSIDVGPGVDYVDFLMPGIFVQTLVFSAMGTGVGLAEDLARGLIDRFHSLPMSRAAMLTGRTLSDLIRNTFVIAVMFFVGLAVGFRFGDTTVPAVLAGLGLMLLFSYAFSWVSAFMGLAAGSSEAAQSAGFIWVFPLVFTSSTFVRVDTLPGWLQPFAEHQPMTSVVDATRALFLGGPVANDLIGALVWSVVILVIFGLLASHAYRRATIR